MHVRGGGVGACVPQGVQWACVEGRCPAPLKTKGKKRGNDLSEAFFKVALTGYRLCEGEARWKRRRQQHRS